MTADSTTVATTGTVKVMSAEEIVARGGGETVFLQWPERRTLFAERALRLRQLAAGHAMRDYLIFMADLADAQHALLQDFPSVPLPDAAALERAGLAGQPPLPAADWPRDPAWRAGLQRLVVALRPRVPAAARPTLDALAGAEADELERQADRLLGGVMLGLDLGAAPLVAAALQVYWTHLLLELQRLHGTQKPAPVDRILDAPGACPCCGSRPTASITRLSGDVPGQRYLHCSLCSLQWHLVRVTCSHCGGIEKIAYQSLVADGSRPEPTRAVVQAETCDHCDHYLKVVHMDRDPHVDPVADDLATVTLDLLVSEAGKARHGLNFMLLFGDPDAPPEPGGDG